MKFFLIVIEIVFNC